MEDKPYGVPIHLIEQLKQFQISLKRKRDTKHRLTAQNRMLSIIPFPFMPNELHRFRVPQQNLISVDDRIVEITLELGVTIFKFFVRFSRSSLSDSSRISTVENFQREI